MLDFAESLAATGLSQALADAAWAVPTLQIIHIVAIAILFASVLMVDLRILGFTGRAVSIADTVQRFAPWFWSALAILATTGALMIVTEPVRELMSLSFWIKMLGVATGSGVALATMRHAREAEARVATARMGGSLAMAGGPDLAMARPGLAPTPGVRAMGWVTLALWIAVIFLGRFIAYDPQVWGALSPLY